MNNACVEELLGKAADLAYEAKEACSNLSSNALIGAYKLAKAQEALEEALDNQGQGAAAVLPEFLAADLATTDYVLEGDLSEALAKVAALKKVLHQLFGEANC